MDKSAKFIFQQDAKRIFRHFARAFNIRIVFFSCDERELDSGDDRPKCNFCKLIRDKLGYEDACHKLDIQKQKLAAQKKGLVSYRCHAGMMEAVKPVYNVDKLIGYIMIGQFRKSDKIHAGISKTWKEKFNNSQLEQAFYETSCYSNEQVKNIFGLFSILVDFIVSSRLIKIAGESLIQKILDYLEEKPEKTLSLSDAAQLIYRSPSSLAHLFKDATGLSFTKYQINLKLNKAEEMFEEFEDMSVTEVSRKLGYKDPFYFSKIYRKHRGYSPMEYIKKVRGKK